LLDQRRVFGDLIGISLTGRIVVRPDITLMDFVHPVFADIRGWSAMRCILRTRCGPSLIGPSLARAGWNQE
jgi:hypothetical protein